MKPRGTVPEEFQVRYERAFPSYFTAVEEKRVRELVTNPSRARGFYGDQSNRFCFAVLRFARCAYERTPGKRCGRIIRPAIEGRPPRGHVAYRALCCGRWVQPPHNTSAPAILGEHVLTVLKEVFRPERLHALVERFAVDQTEVGARRTALENRILDSRLRLETATSLALDAATEAERARRVGDLEIQRVKRRLQTRWQSEAEALTASIHVNERELKELTLQEAEFLSAQSGDLIKIKELATDLPSLIEKARVVPFALQQLVHALVERVWVRRLGVGVVEFSVEFPSGVEIKRVFTVGSPRGSQPQRLWAQRRLEVGADMSTLVRELSEGDMRAKTYWNEERVRGAAAYAQYFETVETRTGKHLSIVEIARRTGEPRELVRASALSGNLGPARWEADGLALQPMEAELHRALPGYARRELARIHDVDPEDLVRAQDVRRANRELGIQAVEARLRGVRVFFDAAGKRWVPRSEAFRAGLQDEPNAAEQLTAEAALREAVAALGNPGLHPEDFIPAVDLAQDLQERFPFVTNLRITAAARRGKVLHVRTLGITRMGRMYPNLLFVHAPPHVRNASTEDIVGRWLRGFVPSS